MTDQSNMQKLHIPPEWVERAAKAAWEHERQCPWPYLDGPEQQARIREAQAALVAVIPLIEARERERLAKLAEDVADMARGTGYPEQAPDWQAKADWLRSQGDT